jgi:WhiB family redox-sensing transcriptional regulator
VTTDLPCRRYDVDLFFSTNPNDIQFAKNLCRSCPEQDQCRDFARRNREFGIWGGEDEKERTKAGYKPKRDRVAADCGTEAGAAAHRRAGSEPCTGCLAAEGRAHRERDARRAARAA